MLPDNYSTAGLVDVLNLHQEELIKAPEKHIKDVEPTNYNNNSNNGTFFPL